MFMEERQKDIVQRVNETGRILVSEIQSLEQMAELDIRCEVVHQGET